MIKSVLPTQGMVAGGSGRERENSGGKEEEKNGRYWSVAGYVRSGPNRMKVLKLLDRPQTPNELKKRASMNIKLVSRALRQLADRGVVECKNPKARRGRIYALTDLGELVLRDVER